MEYLGLALFGVVFLLGAWFLSRLVGRRQTSDRRYQDCDNFQGGLQ